MTASHLDPALQKVGEIYGYRVRPLTADEGGGWLAESIDYPGAMGDGNTPEDAIYDLQSALICYHQAMRHWSGL